MPGRMLPAILSAPLAAAAVAADEPSIEELERRCEAAREANIKPLREAEMAKCKANERNDPAWCERFRKDYGDTGRTVDGRFRPRLFDDLPECVTAQQARNRNGHRWPDRHAIRGTLDRPPAALTRPCNEATASSASTTWPRMDCIDMLCPA